MTSTALEALTRSRLTYLQTLQADQQRQQRPDSLTVVYAGSRQGRQIGRTLDGGEVILRPLSRTSIRRGTVAVAVPSGGRALAIWNH